MKSDGRGEGGSEEESTLISSTCFSETQQTHTRPTHPNTEDFFPKTNPPSLQTHNTPHTSTPTHPHTPTCLNKIILSNVVSSASATSFTEVIPKVTLSCVSAAEMKALAASDSPSLKNPTTTTSSLLVNARASSTVVSSFAGGPVLFFNQFTISAAVRPPVHITSKEEGRTGHW